MRFVNKNRMERFLMPKPKTGKVRKKDRLSTIRYIRRLPA